MTYTFDEIIAQRLYCYEDFYINVTPVLCIQGEFWPRQVEMWYADCVIVVGDVYDDPQYYCFSPDLDGKILLKIPAKHIGKVYDEKEVDTIQACIDVDAALLSYAT